MVTDTTDDRAPHPALRLRPPGPDDEVAFRAACDALAEEGFNFGLGLEPGMAWDAYLKTLHEHRAGTSQQAGGFPEPSWSPTSGERWSAGRLSG